MKKMVFLGIFIFSLLLNFTVAGVLGWHYLVERRGPKLPVADCPMLTESDTDKYQKFGLNKRAPALGKLDS